MELTIEINQHQNLNQQMIQSMEILQMSITELENYIENLSMENPVVDLNSSSEDTGNQAQEDLQRKLDWLESTDYQNRVYYQQDRSAQDASANWHDAEASAETLADYLLSQMLLHDFSETERRIIHYLAESLDSRGYFTEPLSDVAVHFSCSEQQALDLLCEIQQLDPAGVGARDLKERLLLQLERLGEDDELTTTIVRDHLEDIAKNHQQILARKLNVDPDEVYAACDVIRRLNPKPGNSFSSREHLRYISPDAVVIKLEDHFEILVNEYQYPHFTINSYYQNLYQETQDTEAKKYLQDKIQQAEWVQNCIQHRTSTLSRVIHAIVELQEPFFIDGPGHKNPLRLTDLATALDLHESTISRCLRSKYLQCSYGVFPLSYFLTPIASRSQVTQAETTVEQAKEKIRQLIAVENKKKPFSDQALSEKLKESDIHLSRRTVNKYRTEMGIPDKNGRKV